MSLLDLPRVPEPEVMDDSAEVEAYSSAAAQAHLDAIDDTFVEHAVRLLAGRERGRALDIGTGPGQIVIKLARRLTLWKFVGVDRSQAMIAQASANLAAAGSGLAGRVEFQLADGNSLPFPDKSFDFVMCNSVLHHLAEPQKLFAEIARLAKPGGAILLRDLRRPGRLAYPLHVWRHGRYYSGMMRKLFRDSVRSAYTTEELQRLLDSSALRGARVFEHRSTHIGIERAIAK
jgi:ubiquinone/menaquinone biosynthesis C-methylase UbiE